MRGWNPTGYAAKRLNRVPRWMEGTFSTAMTVDEIKEHVGTFQLEYVGKVKGCGDVALAIHGEMIVTECDNDEHERHGLWRSTGHIAFETVEADAPLPATLLD